VVRLPAIAEEDEAGFKAAGKAARAALAVGLRVKVARIPGEKDPADLILHDGPEAWRACIKAASDVVDFLLDVLEEKLPQPDRFRRAAETIVVPFVAEVQSPIDRDAYVRRIAARIGVSESAVAEALARAPREHRVLAQDDAPTPQPIRPVSSRIEQGYAFLIWQESLTAPQCDTEALAKALEDAAGTAPLSELRSRPSEEQERMRFEGERLYGKSDVKREAQELPRLIERERLESELRALSAEQARAEAKGDEAGASALEAQVGVLTTRIAQLHMPV
jgi:DNA primase